MLAGRRVRAAGDGEAARTMRARAHEIRWPPQASSTDTASTSAWTIRRSIRASMTARLRASSG
jgi:hypothetical protein